METKALSSAINKIAVGYIFIYFSINIAVIDILPDWLGYFMIVSALPLLAEKEKSALLLRPFGIALGIWNIAELVLNSLTFEWKLTLISLITGIITIYFHFQLLTNIASLDIDPSKRKRLLMFRTATVILHTLLVLWLFIPQTLINNEVYVYIALYMSVTQIVLCLWITGELFGLSKAMKAQEPESCEAYNSAEKPNEAEADTK